MALKLNPRVQGEYWEKLLLRRAVVHWHSLSMEVVCPGGVQ